MTKTPKPKIGRPSLTDEERASKKTFSIITSADMEARLQKHARRNKRNRNAEVVARLEASLQEMFVGIYKDADAAAISQIIERMMHYSQLSSGGSVWDDPQAHADLKGDIAAVLDTFGPNPGIPSPDDASPRARGQLDQLRRMQIQGRIEDDESAEAYIVEEIVGKLSDKMANKLEQIN